MASHLTPWVALMFRIGVGGVLLWAGLAKVDEPALFAQTVRAYDLLPLEWIHQFAIVMPWMEISVGAFLVIGVWTRGAALGALGLLTSFGVALGVNVYRGADFDCGCFGIDGAGGSIERALVQDGFLIAASVVLLLLPETRGWIGRVAGHVQPPDAVVTHAPQGLKDAKPGSPG